MALPIHPVTMPSTLNGKENGKLPSSALRTIALDDGDTVTCEITASRAFAAAFAQARHDLPGLRVRDVGGYRTYEGQLSLFLSRYKPVSYQTYANTASSKRKHWPQATSLGYSSNYWIKSGNYATAAVPGTSNHGWGLAIDIAENTDSDSSPEGITSRFVNWLSANGHLYGLSAELQSEPWHWRYYTGDALPAAVLAYEGNGGNPTPGDDDMTPLSTPERAYDTRSGAQSTVDPDLAQVNASLPQTTLKSGETRNVFVGMEPSAFVILYVIGHGNGFVSVNDPAGKTAVVGYQGVDKIEYIGIPVATSNGRVKITANGAPCDFGVDVMARW